MEGELVDKFGIKICELPASKVYLFKEQSQDRNAFIADVNHVAKAMHAAFHPDKVNYGAYGDTGHHLHFHLVPKYKDEFEWGGTFAMDPKQKTLTNAEYEDALQFAAGVQPLS